MRLLCASALSSVVLACSCTEATTNRSRYEASVDEVCAFVAWTSLTKDDWQVGAKDSDFRVEVARIQKVYVDTGKDTPVVDVIRRFAPAFIAECGDWVRSRKYVEACSSIPFDSAEGSACRGQFFALGGGNDLDWVGRLAGFDKNDVNAVIRGSWARASREIDICGAQGCDRGQGGTQ